MNVTEVERKESTKHCCGDGCLWRDSPEHEEETEALIDKRITENNTTNADRQANGLLEEMQVQVNQRKILCCKGYAVHNGLLSRSCGSLYSCCTDRICTGYAQKRQGSEKFSGARRMCADSVHIHGVCYKDRGAEETPFASTVN